MFYILAELMRFVALAAIIITALLAVVEWYHRKKVEEIEQSYIWLINHIGEFRNDFERDLYLTMVDNDVRLTTIRRFWDNNHYTESQKNQLF